MPKDTLSLDHVVQEIQDHFNDQASISMRPRQSLEAEMHENDWLLVSVLYNQKERMALFDALQVDSLSAYLLRRNSRERRWNELNFSKMPGGPFQCLEKNDIGELLAIRSIFFMKNNGIGGDIREMPLVESLELLDHGKPVHDMVMARLKQRDGQKQTPKP